MAKTSWDVTFLQKKFPQIRKSCIEKKKLLYQKQDAFLKLLSGKKAFVCEEKAEAFDFFQNMQLKRN